MKTRYILLVSILILGCSGDETTDADMAQADTSVDSGNQDTADLSEPDERDAASDTTNGDMADLTSDESFDVDQPDEALEVDGLDARDAADEGVADTAVETDATDASDDIETTDSGGDPDPFDTDMADREVADADVTDGGSPDVDAVDETDFGTPEEVAPEVAVVFPSMFVSTVNETVVVRGTASDESVIEAVFVGDVMAETEDGFANWTAEVSLSIGENLISVSAIDHWDNETELVDELDVWRPAASPDGVDEATIDGDGRIIWRHEWDLFAWNGGDNMAEPFSLHHSDEWSLRGDLVFGSDGTIYSAAAEHRLIAIDAETGERSVISAVGRGTGPMPLLLDAIASDGDHIWSVVGDPAVVQEIDLATGNRRNISGDGAGTGPVLDRDQDFRAIYDSATETILVVGAEGGIYSVDVTEDNLGERALVSGTDRGAGVELPRGNRWLLALDSDSGLLYASFPEAAASGWKLTVLEIELASGDRRLVTSTDKGTGPMLPRTGGSLVFDDGDLLWVGNNIIRINLDTGDRTVDSSLVTRVLPTTPTEILATPTHVFVADGNSVDETYEVSLETGASRELTAEWGGPMLHDADTDELLIRDGGLRSVNLSSLAVEDVANGVSDHIAWFNSGQVVFADAGTLDVITLSTGEITALSSNTLGSGPPFEYPRGLVLDQAENRALIIDRLESSAKFGLYAVDLATGDRTLLADNRDEDVDAPYVSDFNNRAEIDWDPRTRTLYYSGGSDEIVALNVDTLEWSVLDLYFIESRASVSLGADRSTLFHATQTALEQIDLITGEMVWIGR